MCVDVKITPVQLIGLNRLGLYFVSGVFFIFINFGSSALWLEPLWISLVSVCCSLLGVVS